MTHHKDVVMELVNIEKQLTDIKKIMKDLMTIICEIIQEDIEICEDY